MISVCSETQLSNKRTKYLKVKIFMLFSILLILILYAMTTFRS